MILIIAIVVFSISAITIYLLINYDIKKADENKAKIISSFRASAGDEVLRESTFSGANAIDHSIELNENIGLLDKARTIGNSLGFISFPMDVRGGEGTRGTARGQMELVALISDVNQAISYLNSSATRF